MFVLDCSVAMAWCLADERSDYADAVLDGLCTEGAVVPAIWHLEVLNVLLMAERRGRSNTEKTQLVLDTLSRLPISIDRDTPSLESSGLVALARRHGLSSYDAAYLQISQREQIQIATLDRRRRAAANEIGLLRRVK